MYACNTPHLVTMTWRHHGTPGREDSPPQTARGRVGADALQKARPRKITSETDILWGDPPAVRAWRGGSLLVVALRWAAWNRRGPGVWLAQDWVGHGVPGDRTFTHGGQGTQSCRKGTLLTLSLGCPPHGNPLREGKGAPPRPRAGGGGGPPYDEASQDNVGDGDLVGGPRAPWLWPRSGPPAAGGPMGVGWPCGVGHGVPGDLTFIHGGTMTSHQRGGSEEGECHSVEPAPGQRGRAAEESTHLGQVPATARRRGRSAAKGC